MLTLGDIRAVNRAHRAVDKVERHKWPIRGRFSVAERAIRQARYMRREGVEVDSMLDYDALLCELESIIVNDSRNW